MATKKYIDCKQGEEGNTIVCKLKLINSRGEVEESPSEAKFIEDNGRLMTIDTGGNTPEVFEMMLRFASNKMRARRMH